MFPEGELMEGGKLYPNVSMYLWYGEAGDGMVGPPHILILNIDINNNILKFFLPSAVFSMILKFSKSFKLKYSLRLVFLIVKN